MWSIGLFLRIPVLAAPPLARPIAAELGLDAVGIGALTTVPLFVLALGAVPAAWATGRFGVRRSIAAGLLISATMSAARGRADSAEALFAASIGMGLGIALFQTALPSAVKAWLPRRVALGSAVYLNGMMVGELSGAGLTLPVVLPLADGDWRVALAIWAVPAAAVALVSLMPSLESAPVASGVPTLGVPSRQTWALGLSLAASIAVFTAVNAYLSVTLAARGESDSLAALLLVYNAGPLAASLLLVPMGARWVGRRRPVAVSGALGVAGLVGFATLTGLSASISAVVAGIAATVQLILLVSLPPVLAHGRGVARLSATMTLLGYSIAFALPLAGGALAEATGTVALAFAPTATFAALVVIAQSGSGAYRVEGRG